MSHYAEWERDWTDEQLEHVLLGGAQPGSPNYEAAKYILEKRRRERESRAEQKITALTVAESPVDFSFLRTSTFRKIAERDWSECQRAFQSRCWKSVLILSGGLVETVLLTFLSRRAKRARGPRLRLALTRSSRDGLSIG